MLKLFQIAKDIGLTIGLVSTAPVVLPLKVLPILDPVTQYGVSVWNAGCTILKDDIRIFKEKLTDDHMNIVN